MTISYTWGDIGQTYLHRTDDSLTELNSTFVLNDSSAPGYAEYQAWVGEGNVAGDWVPFVAAPREYIGGSLGLVDRSAPAVNMYADLATSKTTHINLAKEKLKAFVREGDYGFDFFRAIANDTFTLPAGTQTKFNDAYALYDAYVTEINNSTDIVKIFQATIDYEADTYNVPY